MPMRLAAVVIANILRLAIQSRAKNKSRHLQIFFKWVRHSYGTVYNVMVYAARDGSREAASHPDNSISMIPSNAY
jgi:hypothetical protein